MRDEGRSAEVQRDSAGSQGVSRLAYLSSLIPHLSSLVYFTWIWIWAIMPGRSSQ